MGRGNVRVTGKYEGLFYVDHDDLMVYEQKGRDEPETKLLRELTAEEMEQFEYDEFLTQIREEDFESNLITDLTTRFPSLSPCDKWITRSQRAIMENALFYIALEDNEWSTAVELLQKEDDYRELTGLQKRHFSTYLGGIRDALFEQFETLGVYGGIWTHGIIKRSECAAV